MISAYMDAVARDRAADRGCTGGGEVADDAGPPGNSRAGFYFFEAAQPGAAVPSPERERPFAGAIRVRS